jgi:NhaP-type Na+/H+ or K+/H+ antiporter
MNGVQLLLVIITAIAVTGLANRRGLQLRFLIDDVRDQGEPMGRLFGAALLVLLVVIAIRPAWVFLVFVSRLLVRRVSHRPLPAATGTWKHNALISWTGMRGVVTLAAASGVPLTTASGQPFPGRANLHRRRGPTLIQPL